MPGAHAERVAHTRHTARQRISFMASLGKGSGEDSTGKRPKKRQREGEVGICRGDGGSQGSYRVLDGGAIGAPLGPVAYVALVRGGNAVE
jgi:hypothetical protein